MVDFRDGRTIGFNQSIVIVSTFLVGQAVIAGERCRRGAVHDQAIILSVTVEINLSVNQRENNKADHD